MFQIKIVEKITYFMFSIFPENRSIYGTMWKNMVETDRPQMTIWRMRLIKKAAHTHAQTHTHFFPLGIYSRPTTGVPQSV
jgi:hypothetical protein